MLVAGINDGGDHVGKVAKFLSQLRPAIAYLSVPVRLPMEKWVKRPVEEIINRAYHILSEKVGCVECLIGYEGNAFTFTGNVEEDLLSITAVHPLREEAVKDFLARAAKKAGGDGIRRKKILYAKVYLTVLQGSLVYAIWQAAHISL